jgi:hypothetical protein
VLTFCKSFSVKFREAVNLPVGGCGGVSAALVVVVVVLMFLLLLFCCYVCSSAGTAAIAATAIFSVLLLHMTIRIPRFVALVSCKIDKCFCCRRAQS